MKKNNQNLRQEKINSIFYFLFFKFSVVILLSTFYFLFSDTVSAATLYLKPSGEQYQLGDAFIVEVRIDTEEECINAVEANLSYDRDILRAVDFSYGSSIIILWVKPPEINQESGRISFSGGIPGGYCGKMLGDPGPTHILGKITFQASNKGEAKVNFLDSSQVLLNDGSGTPLKLTAKGAVFNILPGKLEVPKNEWQEEIGKDNIPPEFFKIEIHQEPSVFDGKYFIVFLTADKQTGIDYYEIKEGRKEWKTAQSPYLLENQKLTGEIKIKAVDKAGNERVAVIEQRYPLRWYEYPIIWVIIIVGIIIGYILWRIKRKK